MTKNIPFRTAYSNRERVQLVNDEPSLTKQCFQSECDINSIMKKWERTGVLENVRARQGHYGDFTNVSDYQSAVNAVVNAQEAFDSFPATLRARFRNDPALFLEFVDDPSNIEEMISLGLAERREAASNAISSASEDISRHDGNEVNKP